METEEHSIKENHTYLLSGRDILSFFLPLMVMVLVALVDSWMRNEKVHLTTDQRQYVYTRISFEFERFYSIYIAVALVALVTFFRSKRCRIRTAALCALVGNFLIGGGLTLLWWGFRDLGTQD
jgi:hypothetical protein